jgi:alkylhydroperoxidase family enzyme
MSQRYFRTNDANLYESIRLQLDGAWGHPSADGLTKTCIDPASVGPRDASGRILLAVRQERCEWEPVTTLLPQLLASGGVEEIDAAAYDAVVNSGP